MAKVEKDNSSSHSSSEQSLPFAEVTCKRSGKIRRFAFGTEAGFAVKLINKKPEVDGDSRIPLATYIEAVKEGEIPVIFGPSAPLVDFGPGWKWQTVNDYEESSIVEDIYVAARRVSGANKVRDDSNSLPNKPQPALSFFYLGKILLAFILLFIFGGIFTLFLENLPQLILYMNSSV